MMLSVAEVERLYDCCDGLTLSAEQCEHALFEEFSGLVNDFRWVSQNTELDEEWDRLLARMRRYRYFAGSTPLPFNHPQLLGHLDLGEARRLVQIGNEVYPSISRVAGQALSRLRELVDCQEPSPLLAAILMRMQGDQVVLALTDRQLVEAVAAEIASLRPETKVVPASMLSRPMCFDHVILAGDRRNYPEQVFTAPRAPEITIVAYEWQEVTWEPEKTLTGRLVGKSVVLRSSPKPGPTTTKKMVVDEDSGGLFEAETFARAMQREAERAEFTEYDLVVGRLHRLASGQGVYLPTGEDRILVVDPYLPPKKRLSRIKDEDLEVGMFVVLRTGKSGSAVVQVANQLLGWKAFRLNDDQLRWKSSLRSKLAAVGIHEAARRLSAAGVEAATNLNIKNWASDVVIAPGSPRDFAELMKFCGLEAETARLWAGVKEIRSARLRAGMEIREALEEKLEQVNPEKLTVDGEEVFELEEYPHIRLGAYQVAWRSPRTSQINGAELERVIELGD